MSTERTLAERISDALRALTREPLAVGAKLDQVELDPAKRAEAGELIPAEPGLFEDAVRKVSESLEHWRSGRSPLPVVQETGRDRIAALGREVELVVKVEALYRGGPELTDRVVRFAVDGKVVGEARTDDRGLAHLGYLPTAPGLHPVTYEVVTDKGFVLRSLEEGGHGFVHVVTDEPVALVDAGLLIGAPGESLEPLRALARRGWQVCYLDFDATDRSLEIRALLERESLPQGAVVVHPTVDLGFRTLQVDFAPIFANSTVRRMRAHGVPAMLAVVTEGRVAAFAQIDGLTATPLAELARMVEDGAALEEIAARGREFAAARDSADLASRFTRALDLMTGSRLVAGNEVHAELDNRRARDAVFAAIENAERSVHLQFYILREGRFAEGLAARLVVAARRGVRVRMVVDSLYSGQELLGLQNPVAKSLAGEPNVEVLASDPISLSDVDAVLLKQRDHRKLVIVDGRAAFVSGRNAGDEYYESFDEVPILDATPHDRIPWLDAHFGVRGPLVADLQRVFVENWRRNGGGEVADDETVFPVIEASGTSAARMIHHDGLADANALLSYEAIIHEARHHVLIVNDFPVLASLAATMLRAVQRGVWVEFLTGCAVARRADGSFFKGPIHRELFEYMTKRRFETLLRGGVRVWEVQVSDKPYIVARGGAVRPYVHAKIVSADGEVASIGSANLDVTAAYWEREVNVVVEDPVVVRDLEDQIRSLIKTGVPLDPESDYWKREAARRAITDTLWPDRMYS